MMVLALTFTVMPMVNSCKFIEGVNFDKQPDMNFTGSNTKMGSLITFKGANANFALGIERVFITAVSEQIFELSESASTVLD